MDSMSNRDAKVESRNPLPDLIQQSGLSHWHGFVKKNLHHLLLSFRRLVSHSVEHRGSILTTAILSLELIMREVNNFGHSIPMSPVVWVMLTIFPIVEEVDIRQEVIGDRTILWTSVDGDSNFGRMSGFIQIPDLDWKSDEHKGAHEFSRNPATRPNKHIPFHVSEKLLDFFVRSHELSNVSEERENVNVAGKDVEEKASVQILPSYDSVSCFSDDSIPHVVNRARPKTKAKILSLTSNFET